MFLGDFRTIVEHLIMLLEKQEFIKNSMNTGWLVPIFLYIVKHFAINFVKKEVIFTISIF